MRKSLLLIIILSLILTPVLSAALPGAGVRISAAEGDDVRLPQGNREDLSVLSFETQVDEETDEVHSTLILENTGLETVVTTVKLPRISAGIQKGSLSVKSSPHAQRTAEDELRVGIGPGETAVFSYQYRTKEPLIHARVIGMDLKALLFGEGGRIGHFLISVTLREEDLPLVQEIAPVNYTLEGTTLSVELFNVKPSTLLDRFYLSKETYRNLRGGREFEPNEVQQFVLDHYRDWFRDGLGISNESATAYHDYGLVLGAVMDPDNPPKFLSQLLINQYNDLLASTDSFAQILYYLCLRDYNSFLGGELNPLTYEVLRQQQFQETPYIMAVGYEREPSLNGVIRYQFSVADDTGSHMEERSYSEEELLYAESTTFRVLKVVNIFSLFRVARIGLRETYDRETLEEYLDAIGAAAFVKQKLLDDRDGRIDAVSLYYPGYLYAADDSGPITPAVLEGAMTELVKSQSYVESRKDALASSLSVPAFTHYVGIVDEHNYPWMPLYKGYLGRGCGLEFYQQVVESDAGQALLAPTLSRREQTKAEILHKIESVPQYELTETPFYESGLSKNLAVLECSLTIDESTSMVRTELLIQNKGESTGCECITLPTLTNSIRKDSFKITNSGSGIPIEGGRLYVSLQPGEALSVSYAYQTAVALEHSAAIGMDFKKLLYDPDGCIGHFHVSIGLLEESVPLVTEIFPVCYAFDGKTISLDLWDFAPSSLLDRFYIAKETYRGLRGNREREISDNERAILSNVRGWFREITLVSDNLLKNETTLWNQLFKPKGAEAGWLRDLNQDAPVLYGVMRHLICSEQLRRGIMTKSACETLLKWNLLYEPIPLLTLELLKQFYYEEAPAIVGVEYAREQTLSGVQLYVPQYQDVYDGSVYRLLTLEIPGNELMILQATSSIIDIPVPIESANLRSAVIVENGRFSSEELSDYLAVIGASLFMKSQLLDNRDGKWDALRRLDPTGQANYVAFYCSVPANAVYTAEDLKAVIGQNDSSDFFTVFTREDDVLTYLGIPAFTLYFGVVLADSENRALVRPFYFGAALGGGSYYHLQRFKVIFEQEHAKTLLEAQAMKRLQRKETVLQEINSAKAR